MSFEQESRFVNHRTFLYVAVLCIFALLSCFMLFLHPLLGMLLLFFVLAFCLGYVFLYIESGDKKRIVTFVLGAFCVVVACSVFFGKIIFWQSTLASGDFRVSGTIQKIWLQEDNSFVTFELNNVTLDGNSVSGGMRVNISIKGENSPLPLARTGDELRFEGFVTSYNLFEDNKFDYQRLNDGVKFLSKIVDTQAGPLLLPKPTQGMALVRQKLSDILDKYLSETNAGIARAMIIGDKSLMDADGLNIFAATGFIHVLSVSGMHISIIAIVVVWICKKCKIKDVIAFLIALVVVFLFAWLAGFNTPILRAAITFCVYTLCRLRGRWYDSLNSLAFACLVLLLFNPFFLFNVSFILSFGSVFGILLFYRTFLNGLDKIKTGKLTRIKQALAVALAVQVTSVCLIALTINKFATYSILSNMIVQPLFVVVFVAMVVLAPLTMVIPLFGNLLSFLDVGMNVMMFVLEKIADLPYSVIYVWPSVAIVLPLLCACTLCSRFVLSKKIRVVSLSVASVLYFSLFVTGIPLKRIENAILPMSNNQTIISTQDQNLYFGRVNSRASESYGVLDFKISRIQSLFLTSNDFVSAKAIKSMSRSFGIKEIYVPVTFSVDNIVQMLDERLDVKILDGQDFVDKGQFVINPIIIDNEFLGYQLLNKSTSILLTEQSTSLSKFDEEFLGQFDILRSNASMAYFKAVQIVDYSFFDVSPELVFVRSDMPKHYFNFLDFSVRKV